MRLGFSVAMILLGPALVAAVTIAVLAARRRGRLCRMNDTRAARLIVTTAVLAAALATLSIVVLGR